MRCRGATGGLLPGGVQRGQRHESEEPCIEKEREREREGPEGIPRAPGAHEKEPAHAAKAGAQVGGSVLIVVEVHVTVTASAREGIQVLEGAGDGGSLPCFLSRPLSVQGEREGERERERGREREREGRGRETERERERFLYR